MNRFKLMSAAAGLLMILAAPMADAVQVAYQVRHFNGTVGQGNSVQAANPCCGPAGTYDTRTTGFLTSMTTNGTILIPAGRPYFGEISLNPNATASATKGVARLGDVNTANGALTIQPNQIGIRFFSNVTQLPPGWLFVVRTASYDWQGADFGPNQGPGTWTYMMSQNPQSITVTNQNTNMTTGGATTTTTTTGQVPLALVGQASGTAGARQFGGTWNIMGGSLTEVAIQGAGTVREVNFPGPLGPGAPLPNGPGVLRTTRIGGALIHNGTLSGPIVASLTGPIIKDIMPWTTGTVMVDNLSILTPLTDQVAGARTDSGVDARTTASYLNGNLQLVKAELTSSFTDADPSDPGAPENSRKVNFDFVPEPGSMSLIGAGVIGLISLTVATGRKRRQ